MVEPTKGRGKRWKLLLRDSPPSRCPQRWAERAVRETLGGGPALREEAAQPQRRRPALLLRDVLPGTSELRRVVLAPRLAPLWRCELNEC
ncbi:hypothetical protein GN956_G24502 [Arapaima gigas]